ncbi:hypothetical protein U8527_09105 [Kordia algicida OT-1]|uniref:Uncharacterized protein n=1 Tax=Kordia algicida OT-1 TaxID=391587 RepID=A9DU66_9FLAO|nr:hypothetical protein [Kordia algicida]EDP96257.1 hypothetical protein KAOT1_02572 [Kordia algicida OT-1]
MALEKINIFFYIGLLISFIIFLLPGEYKIAVYTPNYLGWFMLSLAGLSLLTYFWLLMVDFKKKNFKRLLRRTLFLITIIGISVAYWFYKASTL